MSVIIPQDDKIPTRRAAAPRGTAATIEELLTVNEVAERLGVTHVTVRERIKEGRFHPIRAVHKGRKKLLISPHEVDIELARIEEVRRKIPGLIGSGETTVSKKPSPTSQKKSSKSSEKKLEAPIDKPKIPVTQDGEKCAQAVQLFRNGKTPLDVVVEMKVDFEVAEYFWKCYERLQPGWFLAPKQFARIRVLLGWEEDPPTAEGFSKALNKFIGREISRQEKGEEAATSVESSFDEGELTPEEKRQIESLNEPTQDD